MKSGLSKCLGVSVVLAATLCNAADVPAASTNSSEKLSYSIGMSIGSSIKRAGFEVDPEIVSRAIKEVLSGAELKMTEQEAQQTIMAHQQELRAKRDQERQQLADKNRAASEKFLAENKQKAGIRTLAASAPDGSSGEAQYQVVAEGDGESPRPDDVVTFNYTAKTIDGKEIDSSTRRGQPMQTVLKHYPLAGVREALQKMKAGGKWQLFLPPSLAFGDMGAPNVEPGSVVVYDLELVSFEAPQPLTSDIIKVPSKEELDKGAKIEVIKAEDVKKMQQQQQQLQRSNSPSAK
ncbi:MAG TPA: FKBP-type peptidyl-prolyl cis-trans isomerase N-terminal domain-containing protein [Verrucomicrobiae bacterium]|nr:FKBP-type peptidyl-prolyl cis-trans isomerase N-terminal domain-containing protein [Verrucomicrobiae bacterium]